MDIETLLAYLQNETERNGALQLLENIIVDTDPRIMEHLAEIIPEPGSIEDTDPFASLLTMLPSDDYIPPLIGTIAAAGHEEEPWLTDYMYALASLLSKRDEHWPAEAEFVDLIGAWLSYKGNSDISCQAATILGQLQHPGIREYLIRGASGSDIALQARIECIHGLACNFGEDEATILEALARNPEPEVRQAAAEALAWVREASADRE
jgi:hypothetical protein